MSGVAELNSSGTGVGVILVDHGYELMSVDRPPLDPGEQDRLRAEFFDRGDPDPLHVDEAYEDGFVAGVSHAIASERRRTTLAELVFGIAIAFSVGVALGWFLAVHG